MEKPFGSECRIALDDTDWAIKLGLLQVAHGDNVQNWFSMDGTYRYHLLPSSDPFEGIGHIDEYGHHEVIYDPDLVTDNLEPINPSSWTIGRVNAFDLEVNKLQNQRTVLPSVTFVVDEAKQEVSVIEIMGPSIMDANFNVVQDGMTSRPATFKDIAELQEALDALNEFLKA